MNKLLAIGLAACLPAGIAAEQPADSAPAFGSVSVVVIEYANDAVPDVACARTEIEQAAARASCAVVQRAVLSAHLRRGSVLSERGRWL